MRVEAKLVEPMPGDKAAELQHLVLDLPLDRRKRDGRRLVAGRLENAPKQAGVDGEPRARPLEDGRKRAIGEIGVGAPEVEYELDRRAHHQVSVHGRKSISKVHALRFWRWSQT